MGILITPGTFNAPNQPGAPSGVFTFPKIPEVTLNRWEQAYTKTLQVAVLPGVKVTFSSVNYTSGVAEINVAQADFNSSKTTLNASGVRYLPNGEYTITSKPVGGRKYIIGQAIDPVAANTAPVDLGTVIAEYGQGAGLRPSYTASTAVAIYFDLIVKAEGITEEPAATYKIFGRLPNEASGRYSTSAKYNPSPEVNGYQDQILQGDFLFPIALTRNGAVFDRVAMRIPYKLRVIFKEIPANIFPKIPEIISGITINETLYGKTATNPQPHIPTAHPFTVYLREMYGEQGEIR